MIWHSLTNIMKKTLIITMVLAFAFSMSLPALATTNVISTGLIQDQGGSGVAPIVKAKWEMNSTRETTSPYGYLGTDDSTADGAQFNPTGVKDVDRVNTLCAIVTDGDGLSDINGVYADVYYPTDQTQNNAPIDLGPSHVKLSTQSGLECGLLMQEDTMTRLTKDEGIALFCNKIRNGNNNLPTFNTVPMTYTYDEICKTDGELMKETAYVACVDKHLSYEDASGMYKVTALVQDVANLNGTLDNQFEYLPLTAFETDFSSVNYGNVKLNTNKIIIGDLTWDNGIASVRNIGNTRMNLQVMQDDMGLDKTSGNWNVRYDARVGSVVAHQNYYPDALTTLDDALDLSEMDEVDFSILVTKFPLNNSTNWTGTMTLSAVSAAHLTCYN